MDPVKPPLAEVGRRLIAACDAAGLDYVLIGGLAAAAYGSTHRTEDVDVCIDLAPDDAAGVDRFLGAVEAQGFRIDVEALRQRAARGRSILFLWLGRVRADALLRRGDGYWDAALRNRRSAEVEGQTWWVAAPEDIVLLKLAAGRPKDLGAVDEVLATQWPNLDFERLRRDGATLAKGLPDLAARLEDALRKAEQANRGLEDEPT